MDVSELIRPNILTLEPYQSAREKIQEGVLLDANENPYSQQWQGVGVNRYPDPYQRKLREAIARYLGISSGNVAAGALSHRAAARRRRMERGARTASAAKGGRCH